MNLKEKELVTEDFCFRKDTYNICVGGQGGFSYINSVYWAKEKRTEFCKKISPFGKDFSKKYKDSQLKGSKKGVEKILLMISEGKIDPKKFLGKKHSSKTKQLMSEKAKERLKDPTKNTQYGTCWITNGQENKKIKKELLDIWLEKGYYKGRSL